MVMAYFSSSHDLPHPVGGQVLVVVVVDHDHRCGVAGTEALELDEGAAAVRSDLALFDAELLADRLEDLSRPAQLAGEVGADADAMPAYRAHVVHVIEGHHSCDSGDRQLQQVGHRLDRGLRQPAAGGALRDVQGRQGQGFEGRVLGTQSEDLVDRALGQALTGCCAAGSSSSCPSAGAGSSLRRRVRPYAIRRRTRRGSARGRPSPLRTEANRPPA